MKRYIDIDSGRRNRFAYPKIGDFVVNVNSRQNNTPTTSTDPVILAFPYETNQLSGGSTVTQIALSVTSSNIVNFYRNSYIEINGNYRKIISYDNTVQIAVVSPAFPIAYPALTRYTIRKELPIELAASVYQEALPVNTAFNTFTPGPLAAAIAGPLGLGLQDLYVFVAGATPPATYQWGRLDRILAGGVWTGSYRVICTKPGTNYGALLAGTIYEILRFSFDNVIPLRYMGTENMGNAAAETVRLVNIVVPTSKIQPSYGTLQNWPYIYVSVYSEKGSTYSNNIIISNNPASNRCLFKVPVSFLPNASWLTLSLSAMNQNITFRENDALHISVYLPNGDILDFEPFSVYTYFQGFGYPIESNPDTQINVTLEITRNK